MSSKRTQCSLRNSSTRHSTTREPPLPLHFSLNVHSFIRSKKLIEQLHHLGISISYETVIQTEKDTAYSLCAQSQANDIVCPSHLRMGLFIGAMDNIAHDPSSKTAQSSIHAGVSLTVS